MSEQKSADKVFLREGNVFVVLPTGLGKGEQEHHSDSHLLGNQLLSKAKLMILDYDNIWMVSGGLSRWFFSAQCSVPSVHQYMHNQTRKQCEKMTLNLELAAFQIKSARCDKRVRWNSPMLAKPSRRPLNPVHLPFFVRRLPLRAVSQPSLKIQFDLSRCAAAWLLLCQDDLITSC